MFEFLCILNIFFYYFLLVAKVWFFSSKLKKPGFINPFTIVFFAQLPVDLCRIIIGPGFILEKGLFDEYYNFAVLMTSVGLLSEFVILYITYLLAYKIKLTSSNFGYSIKRGRMLLAASSFYFLYLIFFVLLASHSFGLVNWISNPRLGYQLHRTGAGQFWVFAISTLSVSFTLFCVYIRQMPVLFLLFFVFAYSAFLLGSKAIILDFFIFFLIILWVRKFKYLKLFSIIAVPGALTVMVLNFFSNGAAFNIAEVFSYFDYYKNSAMFFKDYFEGKIELFNGQIYLTDFWGIVPRALFPDKPYAYGITLVNEIYWPGAAEETNTPAFGGPLAYFADFGIWGVIIFSIINPIKFISSFFLWQLVKNYDFKIIQSNSLILILFTLFCAPVFLMNLIFPINMVFYFIVIVIIMFHNRLVIK